MSITPALALASGREGAHAAYTTKKVRSLHQIFADRTYAIPMSPCPLENPSVGLLGMGVITISHIDWVLARVCSTDSVSAPEAVYVSLAAEEYGVVRPMVRCASRVMFTKQAPTTTALHRQS